jgi:hypothetical protein
MKSLTIRLPDVLAHRIEAASLARGVSKSEIVRESLDQPGLPPYKGAGMRDILKESWSVKVSSKPRPFRSPRKQKLAGIIRAKKLHR